MKRRRASGLPGGMIFGAAVLGLLAWLALRPLPGHDPQRVEREFEALGTLFSISVHDGTGKSADVERAIGEARTLLLDYEQDWSAWGAGALGQINTRLTAGQTVTIPPPLQPLYARAAGLSRQSGGLFDVRVGALVQLWGFHDSLAPPVRPPQEDALRATLAALERAPALDAASTRYGPAPGVRLDFGAIAKGDAVDRVVSYLRAAGHADVIVNAGGNLRATGRAGRRPWRIGIRHPRPSDGQRLLATLEIEGDEAMVTSGDYERYFDYEGRRYHHLLDPRSGQPASDLQSVTVVAPADTALADAASTALFIAGRNWPATVRALGLDQVLVVTAGGRIQATPRLATRLRYLNDPPPDVEIVNP